MSNKNTEYEFFKKCFEEGKYDNIITEINKECPICYEKMGPPSKNISVFRRAFTL